MFATTRALQSRQRKIPSPNFVSLASSGFCRPLEQSTSFTSFTSQLDYCFYILCYSLGMEDILLPSSIMLSQPFGPPKRSMNTETSTCHWYCRIGTSLTCVDSRLLLVYQAIQLSNHLTNDLLVRGQKRQCQPGFHLRPRAEHRA
jgi:hypothetical protein